MNTRISTQAIEAAIADLYVERASSGNLAERPSVRELAQTLKSRYGFSGENKRLCEALRHAVARQPRNDELVSAAWKYRLIRLVHDFRLHRTRTRQVIGTLEKDLAAMTARAERSEAREEATQSRWMMETDKARQELAHIQANRPRGVDPDVYLNVCRELTLARQENLELKALLSKNTDPITHRKERVGG